MPRGFRVSLTENRACRIAFHTLPWIIQDVIESRHGKRLFETGQLQFMYVQVFQCYLLSGLGRVPKSSPPQGGTQSWISRGKGPPISLHLFFCLLVWHLIYLPFSSIHKHVLFSAAYKGSRIPYCHFRSD